MYSTPSKRIIFPFLFKLKMRMDNYYSGNPQFTIGVYILYFNACRQDVTRWDAFINRIVQTAFLLSLVSGSRAQGVKHRGGTREAAHVKLPRLFALPIFVAVWYIKSPSSGHCRKIWQRSAVFCAAALGCAVDRVAREGEREAIVCREGSRRMCCRFFPTKFSPPLQVCLSEVEK